MGIFAVIAMDERAEAEKGSDVTMEKKTEMRQMDIYLPTSSLGIQTIFLVINERSQSPNIGHMKHLIARGMEHFRPDSLELGDLPIRTPNY